MLRLWRSGIDDQFAVYPTTLETGTGGPHPIYADSSILLMQWYRRSGVNRTSRSLITSKVILPWHSTWLFRSFNFSGQYWNDAWLLLFFFLGWCPTDPPGMVTGRELIVDASLYQPGIRLIRMRPAEICQKAAVFGYKVHTVLCRQADLPVFILVTPASVHDSQSAGS